MKTRGISDVIVTVLIILIGLAAVAIVWGFLQAFLKQDASQITSACLKITLEPLSCVYAADGANYNATLQIQRGGDNIKIEELKLIFNTGAESQVITSTKIPNSLETVSLSLSGLTKAPKEVSTASKIKTESNTEKLCDASQLKKECTSA